MKPAHTLLKSRIATRQWKPAGPKQKYPEFPDFDSVNPCKPTDIGLIWISFGEPHCLFAPTLPQ
jgi:hypothetical protein